MIPRRFCNIPTLIPKQESNRRRNLPRLGHIAIENSRYLILRERKLPHRGVEWLLHHVRLDCAPNHTVNFNQNSKLRSNLRTKHIHADISKSAFERSDFRQADHCVLCGDVC